MMKTRQFFTLEQFEDAQQNMEGFCLECGEVSGCCEPDARNYECECCGANEVFGAEECLMRGLVS